MHISRIDHTGAGPRRLQAFNAARQDLLKRMDEWLGAPPEAEEAREEVRATLSAVRQIAALSGVVV